MSKSKGALTLAEGHPDYKTDADIVFNNGRDKKAFILRTTRDEIGVWKAKHNVALAGFKSKSAGSQKWAALIDKDCWVFGVDATNAGDITSAVRIGMEFYKAGAIDFLRDIYVKNLNAENEKSMTPEVLVRANQKLYESVCKVIKDAAKMLGVQGVLNFYVFSNSKNWKIPKDNLHMAMKDGGAESVETDDTKHVFNVGSNDGRRVFEGLISHLHLAKLRI